MENTAPPRFYSRAIKAGGLLMITGDAPGTALAIEGQGEDGGPVLNVCGELELLGIGGVTRAEHTGRRSLWRFSNGVSLLCAPVPGGFASVVSTSKTAYVRAQFGQARLITHGIGGAYFAPRQGLLPTYVRLLPGNGSALISAGETEGARSVSCVFTAFGAMGAYACPPVAAFDYVLVPGKEYLFSAVCLRAGVPPQSEAEIKAAMKASGAL